MALVRWRRLDAPGTDEAELGESPAGYRLSGRAQFQDEALGRVDLRYVVLASADWLTQSASVRGSIEAAPVSFAIEATRERIWTINGIPIAAVQGSLDLDLAVTPATNLLSIRRLALPVGAESEVIAAWLAFPSETLEPLRQVYRRVGADRYDYRCPELPFESTLTTDERGFVTEYPPLWTAAT